MIYIFADTYHCHIFHLQKLYFFVFTVAITIYNALQVMYRVSCTNKLT